MKADEGSGLLLEIIPRTMRTIRTEMRAAAGAEFTIPQFRILLRLSLQPSSNNELAGWMGVSAPTMSKMVDKLVSRGYVSRRPSGTDRRQVLLACTRKGLERARSIRSGVQKTLALRLGSLSSAKRRALGAGLSILREIFK